MHRLRHGLFLPEELIMLLPFLGFFYCQPCQKCVFKPPSSASGLINQSLAHISCWTFSCLISITTFLSCASFSLCFLSWTKANIDKQYTSLSNGYIKGLITDNWIPYHCFGRDFILIENRDTNSNPEE